MNEPTETSPSETTPVTTTEAPKPLVGAPAETPKEEPKTETPIEPIAFDKLTLPEGLEIPPEMGAKFTEILNDADLTPAARAQALIDLQAQVAKEASEKGSQAWADLQTKWQDEVKSDPEVGGTKLEPMLTSISQLLDQYGTPELREVFATTGAGNRVEVVKFLGKIAADLAEGKPALGAPTTPSITAASLYPSMKQ